MLETSKNVVWQSSDGRVTSDHCRVTVQGLFSKFSQIAWNVQKTLFDSRPTVAWPQPLSRDRSATFFKIFPNRWKRPKNVVWQSADGRVTSDHCRVTVQRLFSKKILIAWNVEKTLFGSRPTVAWPPTTVTWPFSDFFQIFFYLLETSKKRCLTVGRWSRDLRPQSRDLRLLSRDRSVTFFKKISNCLKHPKTLFDSRPTVAWPQPLFSDFFQKFFQLLDTSENSCLTVGRRSRQLRLGWNVEKMLFESQRTVTWRSGSFVPVVFFVQHHILPRRCISRYYAVRTRSTAYMNSLEQIFVKMENLEILDVGDYNISETITTTETRVAPFGSVTFPLGHSENETRISFTVSEIFDQKQELWTRCFFIRILIKSFANFVRNDLYVVTTLV